MIWQVFPFCLPVILKNLPWKCLWQKLYIDNKYFYKHKDIWQASKKEINISLEFFHVYKLDFR